MAKAKEQIIERMKIVTIEYTLKDEHGNVLEKNNSLTYLHGFKNIVHLRNIPNCLIKIFHSYLNMLKS